jgi:hypothetical protein
MRSGFIYKRVAAGRVRLGAGYPFFPLYYQAENIYCQFSEGGDLTMARSPDGAQA